MGKSEKGMKPEQVVSEAEQALVKAKAKVAANKSEREERLKEGQRIRREIGEAPDTPKSEKLSARVVALQSRVAVLDQDLPGLEKAVQETEAALTSARKAKAESEVSDLGRRLDGLSARITAGLEMVAGLISEHEQITIEMAALARAHALPGPALHRWLLPAKLIRSHGAEALRDALDRARAVGLAGAPAQPRP
jgi:chromosome segregation ATPase